MPPARGETEFTAPADGERLAGPKGADQWVGGRSSNEAARAWLLGKGVDVPPEIALLLAGRPGFGAVVGLQPAP